MKFLKKIKRKKVKQAIKSKTGITLILLILTSCFMMAQQKGINYKALIKDANGNTITNQQIGVLITIQKGAAQTNVYSETHLPTADSNGIIILTLGEGVPLTGDYHNINWSEDDHYLNTKVNLGSGNIDLGSVQFLAVPYAIQAESANFKTIDNVTANVPGSLLDDDFVFGSSQLDHFFDPDAIGENRFFFDKSLAAFRAGSAASTIWDEANRGFGSFATGINTEASGLYASAFGNSTNALGSSSIAFGYHSIASGFNSTTFGQTTQATESNAMAVGDSTIASGFNAMAMGDSTEASGASSVAMGANTLASATAAIAGGDSVIASAPSSAAFNSFTHASGFHATAFGTQTDARAFSSLAIGRYNIGNGVVNSWVGADPVFEIGIGTNISARQNAMTVLKNGHVGIGTNNPTDPLHVVGRLRLGPAEYLEDGGPTEIAARGDVRPSSDDTFNLGTSAFRWDNVYATNGLIQTSDRRDKTNMSNLGYGLDEVLQLQPIRFNWNKSPNQPKKLGLVAQDLLKIIPEVVKTHEWKSQDDDENSPKVLVEMERMGVYYSDLIPVLIKAIQEQQNIIEDLKSRVDLLATNKQFSNGSTKE